MGKKKEVFMVTKIDGESMLFKFGSSVCNFLDIPQSSFWRAMQKGIYQRDGYFVVKKQIL